MPILRKVEFRLYPNVSQKEALEGYCGMARWVYNQCLEAKKTAWKERGEHLTKGALEKLFTGWRNSEEHAWLKNYHSHAGQVAIRRLDLAFKAFFRRVKAGETPGFPRFKSKHRFSGFGFKEHGNGFMLEGRAIRITGIGRIKKRGKARFRGEPKTCEIVKRADKWYASVSVEMEALPKRERTGEHQVGIDWGVETFATVAKDDGTFDKVANPRHLKAAQDDLGREQRKLSRCQKGSNRRSKQKLRVARLHLKVANRRKDFLHQTTARQVAAYRSIAVEKLSPKRMSAKGSGKRKKALNRGILDASAGQYHLFLDYKAEEAGSHIHQVDTLREKPSQTCHVSGTRKKKKLSERVHVLPDGRTIGRDENAARVLLKLSQGWEPSRRGEPSVEGSKNRETVSRAA